jgi:hypothetical protein
LRGERKGGVSPIFPSITAPHMKMTMAKRTVRQLTNHRDEENSSFSSFALGEFPYHYNVTEQL